METTNTYQLDRVYGGEILFDYLPCINYSMQANGCPSVLRCILNNGSDTPWSNITITIDGSQLVTSSVNIDNVAAESLQEVNGLEIKSDPNELACLTEGYDSTFTLTVTIDGHCGLKQTFKVLIMAYDQWTGTKIMPQLTASFVTPNHPLISRVLVNASKFLEKWTGDGQLDEYQTQDPNRVRYQVAAIYEALRSESIVYATPPASFEVAGQRIRTADKVLTEKLGTCIDLSLLMASCFEAAGIHPIIIFTTGHCFVGAWLINDVYSKAVGDDASFLLKQVSNGINEIVLIEATNLTSSNPVTFDQSVEHGEYHLHIENDFELFIDIYRARVDSVRPLPLRVQKDGKWVIENQGVEHINATNKIKLYNRYDLTAYQSSTQEVTRMMIWERKLLDFSLRNNLLNMRLGRRIIPLVSFSIEKLEDYLQEGKSFQILPFPISNAKVELGSAKYYDSSIFPQLANSMLAGLQNSKIHSFQNELELKDSLKYMYRESRTALEENGANNLFLAIGVMKWFETERSQQPRFAPILLLPIEIIRGRGQSGYIIRTRDEEIVVNITLIELLKQQHNVDLSILEELPKDEFGVDVNKIFAIIRDKIRDKRGWNVLEESLIGLFSFNKFVMWNDIHSNSERLKEHPIITSLVNNTLLIDNPAKEVDIAQIDQEDGPEKYMLPVDVDSSQLEAVIDSGAGKTFILHGPPGTGKSQTITNMIANALYQGKRVLFVAEKMAALSVVQSRLEKIGLAPFCLELHSNKVTKQYFLRQMDEALSVSHTLHPEEYDRIANELYAKRLELIEYINALHSRLSSGFSLYEHITGYLVKDAPKMGLTSVDLAHYTPVELDSIEERIRRLDTIFKISGHPSFSPLRGLELKDDTPEGELLLKSETSALIKSLEVIKAHATKWQGSIGYDMFNNMEQVQWSQRLLSILIAIPHLSQALLDTSLDGLKLKRVEDILEAGTLRDNSRSDLITSFGEQVLNEDGEQLSAEWQAIQSKWFLPKYFAKKSFFKRLKDYKITSSNVDALLKGLIEHKRAETTVVTNSEELGKLFGSLAYYGKEEWSVMKSVMGYLPQLHDLIFELATIQKSTAHEASKVLGQAIGDNWSFFSSTNVAMLKTLSNAIDQGQSSIDRLEGVIKLNISAKMGISDLLGQMQQWSAAYHELRDWGHWCREKKAFEQMGLGVVVRTIISDKLTGAEAADSFVKGYHQKRAEETTNSYQNLRLFNGLLFEETIMKYRELTKQFQDLNKEALFSQLASNIPSQTMKAHEASEVGILKRNIKNGGRGTSIRKIIDQIPNLLPKLAPCMLMSPISVAQYIDMNDEKFDIVIFDEASQMPTSEAVGAIARGKSLVVVGDPKQMPPSSFFATSQVDESEADVDDMESILDDCISLSIPSKYLTWHYRSKHESLISFSNTQYYDGKLITFPSIDDQISKVELRYVDGFYDKGKSRCNKAEAEAIVKEVLHRLSSPELSRYSIGIVSFSKVQQNLIEDILTDELIQHPDLESLAYDSKEPIFIKNLENVQGDERDVILFSVGYGPDASGKVSMNFGPLNNSGGERRLNVAVSRARYEMVVFSTLRPHQIDLQRTKAAGVEGLKKFLEFAESGKALSTPQLQDSSTNVMTQQIANELKKHGYTTRQNVGSSRFKIDLAIVDPEHPSEYLLGIICDGERYYNTKTMRDREVVQPTVLSLLHWNIMHIWSMEWYSNPAKVIEKILDKLKYANSNPKVLPDNTLKPQYATVSKPLPAIETEYNSPVTDYTYASLDTPLYIGDINLLITQQSLIKEQLEAIIATEQPITSTLLAKRISKLWGIQRTQRLQKLVSSLIPQLGVHSTPNGKHLPTIWKDAASAEDYSNFRNGSDREILDVPLIEVMNAMKYVINQQIAMGKEDLKRLAAQQLGYARMGSNIERHTEEALNGLQEVGYIAIVDDKVSKK